MLKKKSSAMSESTPAKSKMRTSPKKPSMFFPELMERPVPEESKINEESFIKKID